MGIEYQHQDGFILYTILNAANNLPLIIKANNVRKKDTGVHASIAIELGWRDEQIVYDTMNVERQTERRLLANQAFKNLRESVAEDLIAIDPVLLRSYIDRFCYDLWDESLGKFAGEWTGSDEDPKPVARVISPYVIADGGTLLYAPPGRGKSFAALLMAISADSGASKLWPVEQHRVLFINLERDRKLVAGRVRLLNKAIGLPAERPLLMIHARGQSLHAIMPDAQATIRKHGVEMVVLDSISRSGMGDLQNNDPANRTIDALNSLCPTWLAIAHTPRSDESHVYGSVFFDAGADITVRLVSEQKDGSSPLGIGLQVTKANDIGKPPMDSIAIDFNAIGPTGVRKASLSEFPELASGRPVSRSDEIYQLVLEMGEVTASMVTEKLHIDRSSVSHILNNDKRFVQLPKSGRERWFGIRTDIEP